MFSSYREQEGQELLQLLYENPAAAIAIDTETTGLKVATGKDTCIGVSIATIVNGQAYSHYFATAHEVGDNCSEDTIAKLRWVLESQEHLLIFANVQFDILSLDTIDIHLDDSDFIDICTMAHLIDENRPYNKGVDSLAEHYLGEPGKLADKAIEAEKKSGWHNTTPEQMWDYAVMDAESTYRIWDVLREHARWLDLPEEIWPHKQDLIRVLLAMKRTGVLIDTELASEYEAKGTAEMERLRAELGMNPASNKQMKELLIDQLGLPVLKVSAKTKAPSFTKEVMEEYDLILERMDNPVAQRIKEYRGWQKAVTAAYRPYLKLLDDDGRLRCSYKTHGTVTGRFSCSDPNLQQIPKTSDKPWNGKVKECFIARPGYTLVNADFSQLELRLGTAYAGEDSLKEVFLEGRDIFTEMAGRLGMPRYKTKTLVYSMQYGAGSPRIMSAFGVSRREADKIRANYFNTYPKFRALAERCTARAEQSGVIRLWSGRYRHFQFPRKEGYKAMNSLIQGGAADIVERIMVQVFKKIHCDDCLMLLQVHDSITFEVKNERVDEFIPRIKAVMEDVKAVTGDLDLDVKFAVDVGLWVPPKEEEVAA